MMRTFVIALWITALTWVACQNNETRNEVIPISDPIQFVYDGSHFGQLDSAGSSLSLTVSAGPEAKLNSQLADQFAFNIDLKSLKVGNISIKSVDGNSLVGLDSVDISLRPANRDDYLPLAYLPEAIVPDTLGNGPDSVALSGFELADFINAFPGPLAGELQIELFYNDSTPPALPKELFLDLEWLIDASFRAPK